MTTTMEITKKIDSKDDDIESQILTALRSRVTYLREKADSFTFESVRRLLEEDLKLEKYALDVHKSFLKQHLVQCLEGADDEGISENSKETVKKDETPMKEASNLSKDHKVKKDVKENTTGDDEKMEDSPVLGFLTKETTSKFVAEQASVEENKEVLQSNIKKALLKRSSYIKANSEKITMGLLRRLLEQDLKLEKYSLDPYKKFIHEELDDVLQASDATKSSSEAKRKNLNNKVKTSASKNLGREETSDSDDDDEEEEEEEEDKEKKMAQKGKLTKSEGTGKRKRKNEKLAPAKKTKQTDLQSESDEENNAPPAEKSVKKKETARAGYGRRVEQLKSVIKSCGMSVSPSVYRKVKQAPEKKREETLIKELEEILAKEGLSSNPADKEIKEVKKRKERTKELEGIDTSNIVSSSRRRSGSSFVPPPKPQKAEEIESDESENSDDNDDDDDDEEDEEGEEEDEGEEEEEASQTEGEPNTEDGGEEESK